MKTKLCIALLCVFSLANAAPVINIPASFGAPSFLDAPALSDSAMLVDGSSGWTQEDSDWLEVLAALGLVVWVVEDVSHWDSTSAGKPASSGGGSPAVPEPASLAVLGICLVGLCVRRKRIF